MNEWRAACYKSGGGVMLETIALYIGYTVMATGGVAIAIAIAWLCIEYGWRRWGNYKLLREYFIWKRDRERIPG